MKNTYRGIMYNLEDIGYNSNIFIRGDNDISYLCDRKRGNL